MTITSFQKFKLDFSGSLADLSQFYPLDLLTNAYYPEEVPTLTIVLTSHIDYTDYL